jgi:hypothetical protein
MRRWNTVAGPSVGMTARQTRGMAAKPAYCPGPIFPAIKHNMLIEQVQFRFQQRQQRKYARFFLVRYKLEGLDFQFSWEPGDWQRHAANLVNRRDYYSRYLRRVG